MAQQTMHQLRGQALLLLALVLIASLAGQPAAVVAAPQTPDHTTFLPLLSYNDPLPPSVFGATISQGYVNSTITQAEQARLSWVRYGNITWSEIEPTPGVRNWSALTTIETELRSLSEQGLTPTVVVFGTPDWAQKIPGRSCGPIREDALDAFANFMYDLVARYSAPPYNIRYWEIWNEPDIDPDLVAPTSGFGCWGDSSDPYYGGGYFGEMLKHVYPAVKRANPDAQLISGGLLLDCDPDNPLPGKDCSPGRFFEGILRNAGGTALDIVAYHGYTFWGNTTSDWDLYYPPWAARGGVVLGKLAYLRSLMERYQVDRPIIVNEAGLLCYSSCPADQIANDQANYVIRLYTRVWSQNMLGAVWYTFEGPGWRDSGILDAAQTPRPSYYALTFLANLLDHARYLGPLSSGAIEGYAFQHGASIYQIYWTNDGSSTPILLPPGTRAIYDKVGNLIGPVTPSVYVGFEPIIVEVRK